MTSPSKQGPGDDEAAAARTSDPPELPVPTAPSRWQRLRERKSLWSTAFCVLFPTLVFTSWVVMRDLVRGVWLYTLPHHPATDDWRAYTQKWDAARVSLIEYGQIPSWNPYHCGGVIGMQDAESPFPGPLFLLLHRLPGVPALKIVLWLHLLAASFATRALVRQSGGREWEALLGAAVFSCCGFFAWHFGGGHVSFAPFALLPAALYFWRRSLVELRASLGLAAVVALMALEGGTYALPSAVVLLAVDAAARLAHKTERRAALASLAVAVPISALLAAVKALPVLAFLRMHPRLVPLDDALGARDIWLAWTAHLVPRDFIGHAFVWPEYGCYVGVIPVALFVLGASTALGVRDEHTRARRIDLALFVVALWLSLGNIAHGSLYALLHRLPVYSSLRVPSRWLLPATLGGVLLAQWAAAWIRLRVARSAMTERRKKSLQKVAWVLLALVALDVSITTMARISTRVDPLPPTERSGRFFQEPMSLSMLLEGLGVDGYPTRGLGTLHCYTPIEWRPTFLLRQGDLDQVIVAAPARGRARVVAWSTNRVELDVRLSVAGPVLLNQNYDDGWSSSVGTAAAYEGQRAPTRRADGQMPGLLSVTLPAGAHRVVFTHRAKWFDAGLGLSLAGLALAGGLAWRLRPRGPTRAAAGPTK